MDIFSTVLFWAGIMFMVDGSLGLLFQEKWKKLAGDLNVQRIALIEFGVAALLLLLHYALRFGR